MLSVSQLFIYPIKSLGGIFADSAKVTDRGLQHDRRWLLVDENNQFLTQRTIPQMALLQVFLDDNALVVMDKNTKTKAIVPFESTGKELYVKIWSDKCKSVEAGGQTNEWFSDILKIKCKLVFMPDSTNRRVDTRYASNKEITSFSDAYPFLIIGQASLNDLNQRIDEQLPINRFRPNIVFAGGQPYEEDEWKHFKINDINFYGVKLSARCVVTTINQEKGTKGKEPLQTLATYRMSDKKVYFGQNLLHSGEGIISIGDAIEVKERKRAKFSILVK